jgi:AAA domain
VNTADAILERFGLHPPSTAPGRYYTTCPKCSAARTRAHQKSECLGITIDDQGVQFGCNHCDFKGGALYKLNGAARDQFVAVYDYYDENGKLLFQVCRTADKQFPQRRPDGAGGWAWGTKGVRKVLFHLNEVTEGIANDHAVLIVEGEKDVLNLERIGLVATCNPGGASEPGKKSKWRKEYSEAMRGADVIIVPDHDPAGYAHADAIASMSSGLAKSVLILKLADHWPHCPKAGDISDWLAAGGTREQLDALLDHAVETKSAFHDSAKEETGSARQQSNVFNAQGLNQMTFGPIKYVVPGYIVEGLTLFAGKPKVGKSWLLLHMAFAVAEGGFTLGNVQCEQGDVLYCALEDNQRRLQSRMTKLFGTQNWPAKLNFTCEMPRLAEGGLEFIKSWIEDAERPRLVIIDTLAMVRMPKRGDQSPYEADYTAVKELRDLALAHGIAIVLVHHLRKAEADDVFDTISGTLGLSGAPDTVMIIQRNAIGTTLHAKGRDLIEIEKAIKFDPGTCTWAVLGEAGAIRKSTERIVIVDALSEAGAEPLTPNQIAAACGLKSVNVKKMLARLLADGVVKKASYGKYILATPARVTKEAQE